MLLGDTTAQRDWGHARDYVYGLLPRPDVLNLSEQNVLHDSLKSWLDGLQAEALRKASSHPLWKQIAVRFDADIAAAKELDLQGVPSFVINGRRITGALPIEVFRSAIDDTLAHQ